MAEFNLLDPSTWPTFEGPATPPPSPAEKASAKQIDLALNNPDVLAAVALSEQRGNGFTADNVLLNDYAALSPVEFQTKHGVDAYRRMVATSIQSREFLAGINPERDLGTHAKDVGISAVNGFVQGGLALTNFGLRGILPEGEMRDEVLNNTAQFGQDVNEKARELQSEEFAKNRYADSIRIKLDTIDNEAAAEADRSDDESFVDSLASFGRAKLAEAGSSIGRLIEDPAMLENMVAEGTGSAMVGGAAAKGIGALSRITAGAVTGGAAVSTPLAAQLLEQAASKAAIVPVIGALGGGGSSIQAQQAVMDIPYEQIQKAPAYRELISAGMSDQQARMRLAEEAGGYASIPGFLAGILTGKLVDKIELDPFAKTSAGGLVMNTGRETLEESVQSGVEQFGSNAGVRFSGANPNQDLGEGVGTAVAEGGIAGAGTTLAMQGPRVGLDLTGKAAIAGAKASVPLAIGSTKLALQTLVGAAKLAGVAARPLLNPALKAGEKIKAEQAAQSSVSPENLAPAVQSAAEQAPAVAEALGKIAADVGVAGEEIDSYIANVQQAAKIQASDFEGMPDPVILQLSEARTALGRMPNKFEALDTAAQLAGNEEQSQEDRVGAAAYILKTLEANRQLFEEIPTFLEKVPQDREEVQLFNTYANTLSAIAQTPSVREALKWATEEMQQPDHSGPIDPKLVAQTVDIAALAPQAINLSVADRILNQSGPDATSLTPEQRRILKGAQALKQAGQAYADEGGETSKSNGLDFINRQIEVDGGSKGHQLSLVQHAKEIAKAQATGKPELVKQAVTRLNKFALSHRNKVGAINRSIANGDGKNVAYTAADAEGNGYLNQKGWGVIVGNAGSERAARTVHAEATAIAALANSYSSMFPELGLPQVTVPTLALDRAVEANEAKTKPAEKAEKEGSSTAAQAAPSQATTTRTERAEEPELPSRASQPAQEAPIQKDQEAPVAPRRDEAKQDKVEPAPAETRKEPVTSSDTAPTNQEEGPSEPTPAENDDDRLSILLEDYTDTGELAETSTAEAFPNLVQPGGENFFHSTFKFPKVQRSRLARITEPLSYLYEQLANSKPERAAAFKDLMLLGKDIRGVLIDRMKKVLSQKKKHETTGRVGPSIFERLIAGEQVLAARDRRALNILEKVGNRYGYNQQLLETAIAAGLDWVLNAGDQATKPTAADIAGILEIDEELVSDDIQTDFGCGLSLDMAVRSLAENIMKFWGVEADRTQIENYARGIPEAVAKEVLHGLISVGLVQGGLLKYPGLSAKTPGRVWFDQRPEQVEGLVRSLDGVQSILADTVLIEREVEGFQIGSPIRTVDQTQLHNPLVPITAQQRQALENAQATPHLPNLPVFDLIMAMGEEAFVSLMSKRPYKKGDLNKTHTEMGLNKRHWESVKGLQRSLAASFQHVEKQMAAVREHAKAAFNPLDPNSRRTSLEKTPVYYRHHINKLGRPQMGGLSNPQSDKLAREIFMPTRSVLDLSDTAGADFQKFLMTVGQGIGLKTEKETRAVITSKVLASTMTEDGALRALVEALKGWLSEREQGRGQTLPVQVPDLLEKAGLSMHGVHSLVSVARYELARDGNQDLSRFETFNYLEADGKTNGMINALMLYAIGKITPEWLKAVAKGGAFFGRLGKTLNSHMAEDLKDLYQEGAEGTESLVAELGREIAKSSPRAHQQFLAFKRILAALSVDVGVDPETGDITIQRGLTKNPLTITIYGSGAKGIAGKVTNELLSVLYQAMSGVDKAIDSILEIYPNGSKDFLADLALLTSQETKKNHKGEWYVDGDVQPIEVSALDFELDPARFNVLRHNIRTFLVDPMRKSIDAVVTGHVSAVTDATQKTSQIQSIILKAMFIDKVTQRLAMKQADPETYGYRNGDFLSQQELSDILESLKRFSPIINTGTQSYFLSGSEKSDLFKSTEITVGGETYTVSFPDGFSRSLTGDMSTPAFVYGPTLSGVKAIPTLVVGSGDGQMQLNFLADNTRGSANRVGHVFDGLNMPADAIDDYSTLINQSVFKTWTSNANPVRAAYESFAAFMSQDPIQALFREGPLNAQQELARKELSQVLLETFKVPDDKLVSPADAQAFAEAMLVRLKDLADDTDARRLTYAEFSASIDQMASAESPYVHEGSQEFASDLPTSVPELPNYVGYDATKGKVVSLAAFKASRRTRYDALSDAMTARYEYHLAKIRAEQPHPVVTEEVRAIGKTDEVGAQVLEVGDLPELIAKLGGAPSPTQKEMLRHAGKLLAGSGYRLVFGSTQQLDAWEQANNADRFIPGSNSQLGKIDPVAKVILISNMQVETVIHELVHAATIDKVRAFYANPGSLSKEERSAVERIEGLMEEWLAADPGRETPDGQDARRQAEAEIERRRQKGQKAEALNEFMAWVLGNQDLAAVAQKTKVKNPAWRIIGDALAALKALIWGSSNKGPHVGDSLLSNLRFNTRVLINGPTALELLQEDMAAVALYHSRGFGNNDRLSYVRERLNSRITSWIEGNSSPISQASKPTRVQDDIKARQLTRQVTGQFVFRFRDLKSMQAVSTFSTIQRALMTEIDLNSNALSRMEDLYAHTIGQLKYTDFMADPNAVPPDPNDEKQARDKLDLILGRFGTVTDKLGRSSLMSSFLALAMTSEEFRAVLGRLDKPKSDTSDAEGFDGVVENRANAILDALSLRVAGESGKDSNVRDALDSLMVAMIENAGDQRSYIERFGEGILDKADAYVSNQIQDKSGKLAEKGAQVARTTKSRVVKAGASVVSVLGTMINEQKATEAALGMVSHLNKVDGWNPIKELIADVVGRTRENAPVFDMISRVRATVQQVRQQFRDDLPAKLNRAFTKPVSKEQWTAMFKALGKTDLAAITGTYGLSGALAMLTDASRRRREIQALEAGFNADLLAKAKQLAHFMVTGERGNSLLRNAYAISAVSTPFVRNLNPTPQMIEEVDRLVSLYAIEETDPDSRDAVAQLMADGETEGVEFVTSYLMGQRIDEMTKANATPAARINHYKGHIPSEPQNEGSLIVALDSEHATLVSRGYTQVAAYGGSSADRSLGRRSYYFAPVSGRAAFSQGVLQTVHQTASGVDPNTGFTVGEPTAGRIQDPRMVRQVERMLINQASTTEELSPVFADDGRVIAYERTADPRMLDRLDRSTDLAAMIGAWRGRQAEELLAQEVNKQLIDRLYQIWLEGKKAGRDKEFVNIATLDPTTDDRVLIEAASLIPAQAIDEIKAVFGPGMLMVRRDMLLDTFGARQASIGDLFSGETRWSPKVASDFEKIATGIFGSFGKNAFTSLVGAEKNVQDLVSTVKQIIVVRSVIVPVGNMVSNMFQLLNRGVPLRAVLHGFGAKTAEINSYVKRRQREIDLEAELRAARGRNDTGAELKFSNQIRAIQDSYRRMSIWPLIEAGEFSAISSGQVTVEDLAIADGKWSGFIERKINALKEPLRTSLRYGLVTRDTSLFQGLARAVQYGDFVAKAVLYEDLTSRKKLGKEAAIAGVNEAFVNYNRLAGRSRQYLESVGLLWFYNYKLRILKESAYLLRHNPLRSLLAISVPALPLVGDIGTPVTDNILGVLNDGKLGFSIGPGMGFGSWRLNPWLNLVS